MVGVASGASGVRPTLPLQETRQRAPKPDTTVVLGGRFIDPADRGFDVHAPRSQHRPDGIFHGLVQKPAGRCSRPARGSPPGPADDTGYPEPFIPDARAVLLDPVRPAEQDTSTPVAPLSWGHQVDAAGPREAPSGLHSGGILPGNESPRRVDDVAIRTSGSRYRPRRDRHSC